MGPRGASPRDTPAREHRRAAGVRDSHTRCSLCRRASPLLFASNLCSQPVPPRASEILCLPSPPRLPHPRVQWRPVPRLARAQEAGPQSRFREPWRRVTRRGRRTWKPRRCTGSGAAPSVPRLRLPSSPMHPGKCSPLDAALSGSSRSQATSPRIPRAHSGPRRGLYRRPGHLRFSRWAEAAVPGATPCRRPAFPADTGGLPACLCIYEKSNGVGIETISTATSRVFFSPISEGYYSCFKPKFISHFSFPFYSHGFCSVRLRHVCQVSRKRLCSP